MRESDDGEKDEMYVATSESGLTCVCDKSWAGGRRGAQGPLRIKWGHRCSRPPSYNSTISQVQVYGQTIAPSMWCGAAAWTKDQAASRTFNCAHHLPFGLQSSLLYHSVSFLLLQVLFLFEAADVPGVTRPPITFPLPSAQFLYLLPIQGHMPAGGVGPLSWAPQKTWLEKTLARECDTWGRWHVSRDTSRHSRASLHLPHCHAKSPSQRSFPLQWTAF